MSHASKTSCARSRSASGRSRFLRERSVSLARHWPAGSLRRSDGRRWNICIMFGCNALHCCSTKPITKSNESRPPWDTVQSPHFARVSPLEWFVSQSLPSDGRAPLRRCLRYAQIARCLRTSLRAGTGFDRLTNLAGFAGQRNPDCDLDATSGERSTRLRLGSERGRNRLDPTTFLFPDSPHDSKPWPRIRRGLRLAIRRARLRLFVHRRLLLPRVLVRTGDTS